MKRAARGSCCRGGAGGAAFFKMPLRGAVCCDVVVVVRLGDVSVSESLDAGGRDLSRGISVAYVGNPPGITNDRSTGRMAVAFILSVSFGVVYRILGEIGKLE